MAYPHTHERVLCVWLGQSLFLETCLDSFSTHTLAAAAFVVSHVVYCVVAFHRCRRLHVHDVVAAEQTSAFVRAAASAQSERERERDHLTRLNITLSAFSHPCDGA